jgi:catechol 2,3-dioxygenase-like lactoylglutathione lyase family enzyme
VIAVAGLDHVGLSVVDLETSIRQYATCGFGLESRASVAGEDPAIGNGLEAASLSIGWMIGGGSALELLEFTPRSGVVIDSGAPGSGMIRLSGGQLDVELATADREVTGSLLSLLGFAPSADRSFFTLAGHRVRLCSPTTVAQIAAANDGGRIHLACRVDDIDEACDELGDMGFGTLSSPRRGATMSWVFVRDPAGSAIELVERQ